MTEKGEGINMKRILFTLAVMFGLAGLGHTATDWQGSMRPTLWRSSITCAPTNFGVITTSSVHLHSLTISSPSINQPSFASFYNSTTTAIGGYNTNVATAAWAFTNSTLVTPIPPNYEVIFDVSLSSGIVLNKPMDGVCVNTKWDYSVPKSRNSSSVQYFP